MGRGFKGLIKDQKGQTTIFVALAMMVLVLFLAFMVNVGQMVHDKILTQSVADMIALSAANAQAVGLNEIADLNIEYRWAESDLKMWLLLGTPWDTIKEASDLVDYFKEIMDKVKEMQDKANEDFPGHADKVANLMLNWHNKKYGGSRKFTLKTLNHHTYPSNTLTVIDHHETTYWWYVWAMDCPIPFCPTLPTSKFQKFRPFPITKTSKKAIPAPMMTWWKSYLAKDGTVATYYRVQVEREAIKPFINLADFGFDVKIPKIKALSLAMPTGGNVEKGKPEYFARFAPVGTKFQFDVEFPERYLMKH